MAAASVPRLCGGTFLTLVLEAAKQGRNVRKKWGNSTGFTEGEVLESLIRIVVPGYLKPADNANFRSSVSAYKTCNKTKSGWAPITGQAATSRFDSRIKTDYQQTLEQMADFVGRFVDGQDKGVWLAKALLALVLEDESIPADAKFHVLPDGGVRTKSDLAHLREVNLAALLLGIWHFIVVNREDNGVGRATYDQWCPLSKTANRRQPFKSDIGADIQPLTVTLPEDAENGASGTDYHDDVIEAEIVDDEQEPDDPAPPFWAKYLPPSSQFINYGTIGTQINNPTGTIHVNKDGVHYGQ